MMNRPEAYASFHYNQEYPGSSFQQFASQESQSLEPTAIQGSDPLSVSTAFHGSQPVNYGYGHSPPFPSQVSMPQGVSSTSAHFVGSQANQSFTNSFGMPVSRFPFDQPQRIMPPPPRPPPDLPIPRLKSYAGNLPPPPQPPSFSPLFPQRPISAAESTHPSTTPQNFPVPSLSMGEGHQIASQSIQQFPKEHPLSSFQSPALQIQTAISPSNLSLQSSSEYSQPPPSTTDHKAVSAHVHSMPLPPKPAVPKDEEMVQNIEILSEFVVRNGSEFEEMARSKEAGNPKFSFLFDGMPGSEAAIGYQYFQWMKKKWELDTKGGKYADHHSQSTEKTTDLSATPALISSPAASDMDMDDDLTPNPVLVNSTKYAPPSNEHESDKFSQRMKSDIHRAKETMSSERKVGPSYYICQTQEGETEKVSNFKEQPVSINANVNDSQPSPVSKSLRKDSEQVASRESNYVKFPTTDFFNEAIHAKRGDENVGNINTQCQSDVATDDGNYPVNGSRKRLRSGRSHSPEGLTLGSPRYPPQKWNEIDATQAVEINKYAEEKDIQLKHSSYELIHANSAVEKIVDYSDEGSEKSKETNDKEHNVTQHTAPGESFMLKGRDVEQHEVHSNLSFSKEEGRAELKSEQGKSPVSDMDLSESYAEHLDREILQHSLQQRVQSNTPPLQRDEFRPLPLRREDFEPQPQAEDSRIKTVDMDNVPMQDVERHETHSKSHLLDSNPLHSGNLHSQTLFRGLVREDMPSVSLSRESLLKKPFLQDDLHSPLSTRDAGPVQSQLRTGLLGPTLLRSELGNSSLPRGDFHRLDILRKDVLLDSVYRGEARVYDDYLRSRIQIHKDSRFHHLLSDVSRLRSEGITPRDDALVREDLSLTDSSGRGLAVNRLNTPLGKFDPLLSRSSSVSLGNSLPLSHADPLHLTSSASHMHSFDIDNERTEHESLRTLRESSSAGSLPYHPSLYSRQGNGLDAFGVRNISHESISQLTAAEERHANHYSYADRERLLALRSSAAGSRVPFDPQYDSADHASRSNIKARMSSHLQTDMDNHKRNGDHSGVGAVADAEVGAVDNEGPCLEGIKGWSPGQQVEAVGGEGDVDQTLANEKGRSTKEARSMKIFRTAIADFAKDVLKPSWRDGQLSKDEYKTIVKKAVDKVTSTMQSHQVPNTQEKIDRYLELSRAKITKLVEGYVEKVLKA